MSKNKYILEKEAELFRYNMFLRKNKPSIFRLAGLQLIEEGIDLSKKADFNKNWNLLIDRANIIVKALHHNSKGITNIQRLYTEMIDMSETKKDEFYE